MKKTVVIAAAMTLPLFAVSARAQSSQVPLQNCYDLHFSKGDMGNDYYTNICDEPIGISLIFPHGGLFAFDLKKSGEKGSTGGTGHSQSDYERMGQPRVFVCPAGTRPVDDSGRTVTLNTEHYGCKR